ncbi:MAG: nascent polypeptide-associated complex protein [Methanobacteriaceae archaeon]|nr:nascent polypeptide-associated complex protein [Methanobacteriaceae archaeon]
MLPGAGMNPKQLKQMQRAMKQMGMDMKDVKGVMEVVIKFKNKELVINNPKVNVMNFMGQDTYQISGKAKERKIEAELVIPDDDVDLVASQTGVTQEEARKALEDTNGDLAEAILRLS